jgi:phosphoglycolate phosphatase
MPDSLPPAIVLDLDGTLIDSRDDLALAVNLARRELSLPPLPIAAIVACIGEGLRNLVVRAIPELPPEQLDLAIGRVRFHYSQHLLDNTFLYPTVREALARLHQHGCPLAILTNKPQDFTEAILARLQLDQLFSVVVGGGDPTRPLKPDPASVLLILAELKRPPANAWMVGDHFTDLEAGRRAGCQRCFCRYGFGAPNAEGWDLAVDNLEEFAKAIEEGRH